LPKFLEQKYGKGQKKEMKNSCVAFFYHSVHTRKYNKIGKDEDKNKEMGPLDKRKKWWRSGAPIPDLKLHNLFH
jgi:hypothetical protein